MLDLQRAVIRGDISWEPNFTQNKSIWSDNPLGAYSRPPVCPVYTPYQEALDCSLQIPEPRNRQAAPGVGNKIICATWRWIEK